MITLELRGAPTKHFNLKNFDRERQLMFAWKALHNDASYSKKFKITTTMGETFVVDVMQIRNCVFEEVEFVDVETVKEEEIADLRKDTAKRR